ncbi:hypothetical protein [Candidatus Chloroploca sp. Khr17]|uniref:hypothetical protein n=1 Tax=Candidatus Chloroploca sp. Khr17 TaxID=2496869 RepID=UPI00101BF987|nr:hypothetical protein [Candidatus Chloroploca sp. Khr17]
MPTSAEQRDTARFHEQMTATYRAWVAYLQAQRTLLEVQADRQRTFAFELTHSREQEAQAAQATLDGIAPAQRALFDAVLNQERDTIRANGQHDPRLAAQATTDPDQIHRAALQHLLNDAQGLATEDGRGLLPRGTPDEPRWYSVDVHALTMAPTEAQYALGAGGTSERARLVRTVMICVSLILVILIWMLWPRAEAVSRATPPPPLTVNGTLVTPWPLDTLHLTAANGTTTVLTVTQTAREAGWPTLREGTQAVWAAATWLPLRFCVPALLLADATTVTLPGGGDTPTRVGHLTTDRLSQADLQIDACEPKSTVTPRLALLQIVAPAEPRALGQAVTLPDGTALTVDRFILTGRGEDPTLPAQQARLTVMVTSSAPVDWPLVAPTLRLPNGTALLPSALTNTPTGSAVQYLVPHPHSPLDVTWSLSPAPPAPLLRWRTLLEPPLSREEVLRTALVVEAVTVTATHLATYDLSVTVRNQHREPLLLTATDISLTVQERPLVMPAMTDLRTPLAPGATRTLTVTVPTQAQGRMLLQVGPTRMELRPHLAPEQGQALP